MREDKRNMIPTQTTATPSTVPPTALDGLPEPVQRYLTWTGVVGQPWIHTADVRQSGRFRQGADGPWMPLTAEQRFTTHPPSMVWNATFKRYGLPLVRARDAYRDGEGRMFGKLAGLFTIFDETGEKLTLGTMHRYLAEMIWFPIAYLSDFITWAAVDDQTAEVTFTDGGRAVSGRMTFDDQGRPLRFDARRWMGEDGRYELRPWRATNLAFGPRGGLMMPIRSTVTWGLPEGDFTYGDFNIDAVEYNQPGDPL
jgi:hypothetical protein